MSIFIIRFPSRISAGPTKPSGKPSSRPRLTFLGGLASNYTLDDGSIVLINMSKRLYSGLQGGYTGIWATDETDFSRATGTESRMPLKMRLF